MTGAAGSIGRSVVPFLPTAWDLRRMDVAPGAAATTDHATTGDAGDSQIRPLDVTDFSACVTAFEGADAVVHLAAVPDPAATWEQLLPANVVGAHHVAQAAAQCRVGRLVLASSLQAVAAWPDQTQVRAGDASRPDTLYGATKAWAEALGSWVASTTATTVVALRIGYFALQRPAEDVVPPRERSAWLSPRDAAELIRAAVEADGVTFVVANGISANRYRRADLDETVRLLGYHPRDDAWAADGV
jgi:nucleoside-diphosphate-sugar epimerase